jgi:uncharacterized membrane protein YeaQ/YmgE (transglycosylase-associated protein family)
MHMSGESLLVILFVGIVAGWLAGQIVRGAGFGLVGDLIVGVIGAFVASLCTLVRELFRKSSIQPLAQLCCC